MKNIKIFTIFILISLFLASCGNFSNSPIVPPDECFETDWETIINYDFDNSKCPVNIIIPDKIRWIEITKIWYGSFSIIMNSIKDKEFVKNFKNSKNNNDENFNSPIFNEQNFSIEDIKDDEFVNKITTFDANIVKCYDISNEKECINLINEFKENLWKKRIKTLILSDNIIEIQDNAFELNDINNISFWKNIEIIWEKAFAWNNIKYLDFSKATQAIYIKTEAFFQNYIEKINIPKESLYDFPKNVKITEFEIIWWKKAKWIEEKENNKNSFLDIPSDIFTDLDY